MFSANEYQEYEPFYEVISIHSNLQKVKDYYLHLKLLSKHFKACHLIRIPVGNIISR